jgi:PST family polysaccharide transporter
MAANQVSTQQVASGVRWSGVSRAGRLLTTFGTTIVLARVLPPSDFGLIGMAVVVIAFVEVFKDLGTAAAIIQRRDLTGSMLSSLFWLNVALGLLATTTLFLGAPLATLFFHEQGVVPLLRVLAASFAISGLGVVPQSILERKLAFRALAFTELCAVLGGALVGIGLALAGAGPWSLVAQSLTIAAITTVSLWGFSSWRPDWSFSGADLRAVSSFSLNLVGFNIFNYFARNADYLLIGRYLGPQDLGYYTLAYRILLFPLQNISDVIARVIFPAYSSVQDDHNTFSAAHLRVAAAISTVSFPMMLGIMTVAGPFVMVVFGKSWLPVAGLITILAPVGMVQSLSTLNGSIYRAKGATALHFRISIVFASLFVAAFWVGVQRGISGVAVAYLITASLLAIPGTLIAFRLIELRPARLLQAILAPLVNSVLMAGVVLFLQNSLLKDLSDASILSISVCCGAFFYLGLSWVTNREQLKRLWALIRQSPGAAQSGASDPQKGM